MECDCLCQDMISIELKLKSKSAGGPSPHLRVLLGRERKNLQKFELLTKQTIKK